MDQVSPAGKWFVRSAKAPIFIELMLVVFEEELAEGKV